MSTDKSIFGTIRTIINKHKSGDTKLEILFLFERIHNQIRQLILNHNFEEMRFTLNNNL